MWRAGVTCIKYVLLILTVLICLLGAALLGSGLWLLLDKNANHGVDRLLRLNADIQGETSAFNVGGLLKSGAYVVIGTGGVIFVIGFFGCCGIIKSSKVLLKVFAVLMAIILLAGIAGAILVVIFQNKVEVAIRNYLNTTIVDQYEGRLNTSQPASLAWDAVMMGMRCCGIDGGDDFRYATRWDHTIVDTGKVVPATVPRFCCEMTAEGKEKFQLGKMTSIDDNDYVDLYGCATSPNDVNSNIQTGCYNAVKQVIENHLGLVIGIGVGIALLELLIIIFSCWLSCCYNKEDEDDYKYEKPMSTMEEETANI